jgi:hypothetical protein
VLHPITNALPARQQVLVSEKLADDCSKMHTHLRKMWPQLVTAPLCSVMTSYEMLHTQPLRSASCDTSETAGEEVAKVF